MFLESLKFRESDIELGLQLGDTLELHRRVRLHLLKFVRQRLENFRGHTGRSDCAALTTCATFTPFATCAAFTPWAGGSFCSTLAGRGLLRHAPELTPTEGRPAHVNPCGAAASLGRYAARRSTRPRSCGWWNAKGRRSPLSDRTRIIEFLVFFFGLRHLPRASSLGEAEGACRFYARGLPERLWNDAQVGPGLTY